MEYKMYDCNSYKIHTIKTDKFKTVRMEIIFSQEVEKEKMPALTFLADLLTDCSKKYPRRKDIAIRLEELYKAMFYGVTNKIGNLFTTSFILEFIAPNYIKDKNYLKNVLTLPFEVLKNPRVKNQEFDLTNFNIVKKSILEEIASVKESPDKLAILNSLKSMDSTSPSSFRVLGEKEDIESISRESLYHTYQDLLSKANCDIFLIGNLNMDDAVNIIKDAFNNHVIKLTNPSLIVKNSLRKKPNYVVEKVNFVQSTLVMIYNIHNLTKLEKTAPFHVLNYILGSGGINAKLYQKLRTENSLCYSVRSLYLKYDELLLIEVSLDEKNLKTAEKLIKKCINEMLKGDYSDELLNDAKVNLSASLKMGIDNNVSILNNYVFHYFDDLPLLDERLELIKKVSRSDLIKCAKSLVLNTVYVQSKGDSNARD